MRPVKKILLSLLIVLGWLPFKMYSQSIFVDPREAEEDFSRKDYKEAINVYKKLLRLHPDNINYHYQIGLCYLRTHEEKEEAISYFEWVTKQPKAPADVWYELGIAYHYGLRFEDAIKAFKHYEQLVKGDSKLKADKQMEECKTGEELMKHPVNVTFTNLGVNINSSYPDYYPLISDDGTTLVFTSRRPSTNSFGVEMDGFYSSDIYIAHFIMGEWQKAVSIGQQINTPRDEEAIGLTPKADKLLLYIDNVKQDGRIYYSEKKDNIYSKPMNFPDIINEGFQSSGCLSSDGKILFFASERSGGFGGTDIYMIRKLPNNNWAYPQNLGGTINTPYNEDFPWFSSDSLSLYFSSDGHNTMGDYDLFESTWNNPESNSWSAPRNLGYPINTPDDDRCISFTKNHHVAYVSRVRKDSKGDYDIYAVTFNDIVRFTLVTGTVSTSKHDKTVDALITTTNSFTGEQQYFRPLKKSGHYVMALLPGSYNIEIDAEGYRNLNDKLTIYDVNTGQNEITRNYVLLPVVTGMNKEAKKMYISYH